MTLNTRQTIIMNPSKLYHNVLSLLINDPLGDLEQSYENTNKTSSSSARTCDSTESSSVTAEDHGKDEHHEEGDAAVQQEQLEDEDTAALELSRPSLHPNDNEDQDEDLHSSPLVSLGANTFASNPTAITASSLLAPHTLHRSNRTSCNKPLTRTTNSTNNSNYSNNNSALPSRGSINSSKYQSCPQLSLSSSYCYNSSTSDISDNSNAEYAKWLQKELSREGMDEHDNSIGGGNIMGGMSNAQWGMDSGSIGDNSHSRRNDNCFGGNAAWGDFENELKQYSYKSSKARDFGGNQKSSSAGGGGGSLGHGHSMGGGGRSGHLSQRGEGSTSGGLGNAHHAMSTTSLDSATSRRNRNRNLFGLTASIRE